MDHIIQIIKVNVGNIPPFEDISPGIALFHLVGCEGDGHIMEVMCEFILDVSLC
ncbi:hypothetical protein Tco_1532326, partial [Tanacetum coccineum]